MRILYLTAPSLLVCSVLSLSAQTAVTAPSDDWRRVEQLSPHTGIKISADHKHANCFVDSVNDEILVCSHTSKGGSDTIAFPRAEIRKIKLSNKRKSTLGGLGLGLAVGAGAGAGTLEGINKGQESAWQLCHSFRGAWSWCGDWWRDRRGNRSGGWLWRPTG